MNQVEEFENQKKQVQGETSQLRHKYEDLIKQREQEI